MEAAQEHSEQFVQQLTRCQRPLYAFILSLLPNPEAANDVLQDVNMVMWRKASEFTLGTNFIAWSCAIARREVLAYLRRTRNPSLVFSEALLDQLAAQAEPFAAETDRRVLALEQCLARLSARQRALIAERYTADSSLEVMAQQRDTSASAVAVLLHRARRTLRECIERRLAAEER